MYPQPPDTAHADAWPVPRPSAAGWWASQLLMAAMLTLAMLWLVSWLLDVWWHQQTVTSGQALVAVSLMVWLPWAWRFWRAAPQRALPDHLHWLSPLPAYMATPWHTAAGKPVEVRVLLDAGSHLFLSLTFHDQVTTYCLVSERDLSGPWRWRMLAGQPRLVKTDPKPGRTWHHPQP